MPDGERYYVLKGGKRRGPFRIDELAVYAEKGRFSPADPCLRVGAMVTGRLGEVLPPEAFASGFSKASVSDAHPTAKESETKTEAKDSGPFAGTENPEASEDEGEEESSLDENLDDEDDADDSAEDIQAIDEEEEQEHAEAPDSEAEDPEEHEEPLSPTGPSGASQKKPLPDPATVLYAGRPSILSYPRALLLLAGGVALAWWGHPISGWFLFSGSLLAAGTVAWLSVTRSMRLYLIMPIRLEIIEGLVAKSSREVRITDIRAINVRKPGFKGLLGVGTVEFATAGGDEVDVAFHDVYGADRVKTLVRRLQDHDA